MTLRSWIRGNAPTLAVIATVVSGTWYLGLTTADLKGSVDALRGDVGNLKGSVDTLTGRVDALEDTVDTLKDSVDTLKDSVDTLTGRVDALEDTVDNFDDRLDDLSNQMPNLVACMIDLYRQREPSNSADFRDSDLPEVCRQLREWARALPMTRR